MKPIFLLIATAVAAFHAQAAFERPPERAGTVVPVPSGYISGDIVEDAVTPFSISVYGSWPENGWITHEVTGLVESRVVRAHSDGTYDFFWRIAPSSLIRSTYCRNVDDCRNFDENNPIDIAAFDLQSFMAGSAVPGYEENFDFYGPPRTLAADGKGNFQFRFSQVGLYDPDVPTTTYWSDSSLNTNNDSWYFFLDTDARAYSKTATYTVYSFSEWHVWGQIGNSETFPTFGPTAIPEPAPGLLALAGLGAVMLNAHRRRRRSLRTKRSR